MTNTTDKSILTAAGKALLAQLNAEEKPLVIDKMIFANVPNRPEFPQPDDVVPSDNVVHEAAVEQRGRLSVDSVIYSTTLTSQEGPFEFNWTGAYCSEYGVLVTIDHHALTPKTVDEPGVSGNTLVRSVVLEYKDIAEITNITVDASTWQYNATPRMKKMDDDVAQAIIDQNGKDWFIEDGFLVTPQASAFNIKAGAGYVSGNRVMLEFDRNVQVPNKPSFIYVDAHREGTPTGEQVTLFDFVVTAEEKDDYTDENGVKHFVCKIAQVLADGSVSDLRPEGDSASRVYVDRSTRKALEKALNIPNIRDLKVGEKIAGQSFTDEDENVYSAPGYYDDGTLIEQDDVIDSIDAALVTSNTGKQVTLIQIASTNSFNTVAGSGVRELESQLAQNNTVNVDAKRHVIRQTQVFQPRAMNIAGFGNDSEVVFENGAYWRFAAVGSSDRKITKLTGLNLIGSGKVLDVQAVFPFSLEDVRFDSGKDALTMYQVYYGGVKNLYLVRSGLNLRNVNNYNFTQGDILGSKSVSSGRFAPGDYAVVLTDCDGVRFCYLTFEGWENNVMMLDNCRNITLEGGWFEGCKGNYSVYLKDTSQLNITGYLTLEGDNYKPKLAMFVIDNRVSEQKTGRSVRSSININNTYLRLSKGYVENYKFVDCINPSTSYVNVQFIDFNGYMLNNGWIRETIQGVNITSKDWDVEAPAFISSVPRIDISDGNNDWVEGSVSTGMDMAQPIVSEVGSTNTTITVDDSVTTQNGRSTKIEFPSDVADEIKIQRDMSDMGPVTVEGQTHLIFVRLKASDMVGIEFAVQGYYMEYQKIPVVSTKADGDWTDYILKTANDVTWAQGRQGVPKLNIKVTNKTGRNVNMWIDRIDYKTVHGDVYLV